MVLHISYNRIYFSNCIVGTKEQRLDINELKSLKNLLVEDLTHSFISEEMVCLKCTAVLEILTYCPLNLIPTFMGLQSILKIH